MQVLYNLFTHLHNEVKQKEANLTSSLFISWLVWVLMLFPLQMYRIRQIFRCKHVTDIKMEWCLKSNMNHFTPFWRTRCRWRMWCGRSIRSVWKFLDCQRDDSSAEEDKHEPSPCSPTEWLEHGAPLISHWRSSWISVTTLPL